jgi:hypothetical protein
MSTAIEIAHRAIAVAEKLSPTMRNALRAAARETPNGGLRVGWTGHVPHRTMGALARRGVIVDQHDGTLTDFGRIVHAVAVTSEVDVLVWAGRQDAVAFIAESHDIVISEAAVLTAEHDDPVTVAFRAVLLDELHARAAAEDAERTETADAEPVQACANHESQPAVAVLVYDGEHIYSGHGEYLGVYLCRECVTCSGNCDALGDIIEARRGEPWCQPHAGALGPFGSRSYGPDQRLAGPDIVLLDSDRYHALLAENAEKRRRVAWLAAFTRLPRRAQD